VAADLSLIVTELGRVRLRNLIRGSNSIGTVIGPVVVRAAIVLAGSGRTLYLLLIGAQGLHS